MHPHPLCYLPKLLLLTADVVLTCETKFLSLVQLSMTL